MSLIPQLDRIYNWQARLPEYKFEIIKKLFFTAGWILIFIAIIIWLVLENDVEGITMLILAEGLLVLFVTAMNLDDATYILSTVMWFIGINILFILLFSGLIDKFPIRIR